MNYVENMLHLAHMYYPPGSDAFMTEGLRVRKEKKRIKCALPECNEQSYRAYCCAEHCREHKQRVKHAN